MDRLWSPWRLAYVTSTAHSTPPACVFCDAHSRAEAELVLFRGAHCFVVLNRYPYNNGHLLVVTNRHVASLSNLQADEQADLMALTRRAEIALIEAYHPHGINVGINLGAAAGAGIVDHLHVHLVPRWSGDTSFMSVVGAVRVLPEELGQTAARLRPIFESLALEDRPLD